ncbi:MAG: glycosyltransferase family 4 protein [Promethearchaeota archaeon]
MSKKICYVNPGINLKRPISFLAEKLENLGYQIEIFAPRENKSKNRKATRHYDKLNHVHFSTYPVFITKSGYDWPMPTNLEFLKYTRKILRENDVIHIWVPFYPINLFVIIIKLLFFKKKKLILAMDTFPGYSFKLSSKLDPIFKIFYKTVGKIIFSTANYINIYAKSLETYAIKASVPKKKIVVTPTGIDLIQNKSDKNIRKELSIGAEKKIILYVGLINKRKGVDLIIKTAYKLRDNKDIVFILVGDGVLREKAERVVKKLKIHDNFIFTGTQLDVYNYYNQSDVFLLPSRGEGLAGVLMEAMVYRLPIITSNIAGTQDLVINGYNGFLCKTEDYKEYALRIIELLNNEDLREKFKDNSLRIIKEKFLWSNNIFHFKKLY